MTEGQAPIHYSEKLQTAEQAGRLIQQDIRPGTGQLFFPAESHTAPAQGMPALWAVWTSTSESPT